MPNMPAAEFAVSGALVRRLLHAQHPDLAGLALVPAGNGWDNAMFRLGDDLAVRLPRRAVAAELMLHELRWLAGITADCPVGVPRIVRRGAPSPEFPWPFAIVGWHDGEPVTTVPPADRDAMAPDLAGFVTAVHRPAPPDAPRNPVRGTPLAARDAAVRARLTRGPARTSARTSAAGTWRTAWPACGSGRWPPRCSAARPCGCTGTCTPGTCCAPAAR
ncbi:phosphotransferase [Specibacter cremeus]|uniref:phosphotransferase n=1 Tax=Specibacter cremeus TaxID=1629051 RepID=UPI001F0B8958|nr:phosphotransferase [Specibacter cremeus]